MAIEFDISGLLGKTENDGSTDAGRLTAKEFNTLVQAVGEVQTKVEGTIKGIKYNGGAEGGGQTFSNIDEQGYLEMIVADSSGYQLTETIINPPAFIARGSACPISVYVSSKKVVGDSLEPASAACNVNIYINETLVHSGQVYDQEYGNPENKQWYDPTKETLLTFDLSTAKSTSLVVGSKNEIKIEVNNRFGKINTSYADVNVIELGLNVESFGTENVFTENRKPTLLVTVNGTDAYVNSEVDGQRILTNGLAQDGALTTFNQSIFDIVNTHGVHTIKIWAEVTRTAGGTDFVISTEPAEYTYIYGTTFETPIVMSVISNTKPEEYSTLNISYVAYKYFSTTTEEKGIVYIDLCEHLGYDEDGNILVGRSLMEEPISNNVTFDANTKSGKGSAGVSLFPVVIDGVSTSLAGKKVIKLTIGDYSQYTEIEVVKSSVVLNQLTGYAVYLTSNNRNNGQGDKNREWISNGQDKAGNPLVTTVTFDDNIEFIDTGSGWISDDDGNMAMHLRKGKYFTLNYAPFVDNPTYTDQAAGRGKTISFELATRNCLKNDAPVVTCMDDSNGSERGILITASEAILKSNNFGMSAKFRENTRIKIDFVIEGKQTAYKYNTIVGKDATEWEPGTSNEALAIIYVDGVYQALKVIPRGTTFLQGNSKVDAPFIRFGSEDCDLDVYNIRIYDQALTPAQIVNNYAYDTPKFEDKLAIARRNNIFDATSLGNKPDINMEKLRAARPDLPFWIVKMDNTLYPDEVLPWDKEEWKNMTLTEWKNPANENDHGKDAVSFTSDAGKFRNQGTSSMSYPWPWRNWDWKADKNQGANEGKFILGDGTKSKTWNQYGGIPEGLKKITLKKDYASSEMCNNAITSEMYTDMALGIGDTFPNVLSPAQRPLGSKSPFRMTFRAIPCFMFQQYNDPTKVGTAGKGYEALGMMNLIANKNECGHLGFGNESGMYNWTNHRAQSWELTDNMDDWFWYQELDGIKRNSDGTYTNDVKTCYEARYPKDSTLNKQDDGTFKWNNKDDEADFGMTPDGYNTITNDQYIAIRDEQLDIIDFHNWLVSVNRQIPVDYYNEHGEYRELTGNEYNADWNRNRTEPHTHDTPDYRLDKFKAEAPARMIIDQFCLYYLWREQFWAYDSGFKNLQIYTMGPNPDMPDSSVMQWGCMVRDADTTLGIENTGKDIFPPHLEDIDYYTAIKDEEGNAISNVEFVYGGANNMYHSKSVAAAGGFHVLNGQFGSLWVNIRDSYGARLGEIYRALSGASAVTNWNSTRAIKRFRDHQEKWCENLYNFGMRQYFGGGPFTKWIESGLGDKKNSRASWLDRGFYYRASKYKNLSDYCMVRAIGYETPDVTEKTTMNIPVKMKFYNPMYFACASPSASMTRCENIFRVTDTNITYDVVPGPAGFDFTSPGGTDQNRVWFGSDNIVEFGDMARSFKIKTMQTFMMPKLRELNLGHEKDRDGVEYKEYVSVKNEAGETVKEIQPLKNEFLDAIDCSSLKQLEVLDITNHTNLSLLTDFINCTQLKKLYARGTDSLRSIDFPSSTSLETIYLGKNLTGLIMENLTGIKNFVIEGADKFESINIQNCGSYMAERSYDIVKLAIEALENAYDPKINNNICTLTNVNWPNADASYLERLLDINATLSGKIIIKGLSNELKLRLIAKYGDIDNPDNALYIKYNQVPITSISMPSKIYVYEAGDYPVTFTVSPTGANTYKSAVWTLTSNKFATINSETGVITRNNEPQDSSISATLSVSIKQMPESDGTIREDLTATCEVFFYERLAKPGDLVFNDGTFSDELDPNKDVIGVCFYVDPENRTRRLMCAANKLPNTYRWGISTGSVYNSADNSTTTYYGPSNDIKIEGISYDCYNVPALYDMSNDGIEISTVPGENFSDKVYRDKNNPENDYFRNLNKYTKVGDIGWNSALYNVSVNYTNADGTNGSIRINKDDEIPSGYYNTIALIEHRNKILNEYKNTLDFNGNIQEGAFAIPVPTKNMDERTVLENLLSKANSWSYEDRDSRNGDTYGSCLYYPAASMCFSYEPEGISNLDDKFKRHNWFLPSSGDMFRIMYYLYHSYNNGNALDEPLNSEFGSNSEYPANAFANAIKLGVLNAKNIYSYTYCPSTEISKDNISTISYDGTMNVGTKYGSRSVIPVCAF